MSVFARSFRAAGCFGVFFSLCVIGFAVPGDAGAAESTLPRVQEGDVQPLKLHVRRLREALDYLGRPLSDAAAAKLDAAMKEADADAARRMIQDALDPLCLAGVMISPESRVKVVPGPAPRELVQNGWRQFLVKVNNKAGSTAPLGAESPQARPLAGSPRDQVADRWLDLEMFEGGR